MKTIKQLEAEWRQIYDLELEIETNSGTYGAEECQRRIGVGDSRYGDYQVLVRVGDGRKRVLGCDPARAPGYPRKFCIRVELHDLRIKLAAAKAALDAAGKQASMERVSYVRRAPTVHGSVWGRTAP